MPKVRRLLQACRKKLPIPFVRRAGKIGLRALLQGENAQLQEFSYRSQGHKGQGSRVGNTLRI